MKTGMFENETILDYHNTDGFSASRLAVFRKLPALYKAIYLDKTVKPKAPTAALEVGTAVDCLLLEGVDEYAKRVIVHPEAYGPEGKPWSWNANECKAWVKKHSDKTILSNEEASLVEEMCQTVYRHKDAAALLEHGKPAITFRHDYGFAYGQCRTDWLNLEGTILPSTGQPTGPYWLEVKTAASLHKADFFGFLDAYIDKEYYLQLPLYREIIMDVLKALGNPCAPRPFYLVVDKGIVPFCQIFDPLATGRGREDFDMARRKVLKDVEALAHAYETNTWPGLPDTIQSLELPEWCERRLAKEITT